MAGDFNRHYKLWGGDGTITRRQGEAHPIIDLMNKRVRSSLLPSATTRCRFAPRIRPNSAESPELERFQMNRCFLPHT